MSGFVWPKEIHLRAIDCRWDLRFHSGAVRQRVREELSGIDFYLRDRSKVSMTSLMKRWLKVKAGLEITPWLQRVSRDCGLPFQSVQYRGPVRRWGSCSSDGRICLNYKLLFLPQDYVQYVLVHELCHTVHFDHSADFWQLVSRFVPNWRELRKAVRRSDAYLPLWLQS